MVSAVGAAILDGGFNKDSALSRPFRGATKQAIPRLPKHNDPLPRLEPPTPLNGGSYMLGRRRAVLQHLFW